jgi:2-iminobutanoate/2-iminopropanoate deaminase
MRREIIRTDKAAVSKNPISQGVRFGNLIFTAGVTARDPKTGEMQQGDMRELVRATLNNIKAIVEAGGSSLENVLRVNCYLRDVENDFAAWNEVYPEFFPADWPVRTTMQVVLGGGLRIEVDAIACIPDTD